MLPHADQEGRGQTVKGAAGVQSSGPSHTGGKIPASLIICDRVGLYPAIFGQPLDIDNLMAHK